MWLTRETACFESFFSRLCVLDAAARFFRYANAPRLYIRSKETTSASWEDWRHARCKIPFVIMPFVHPGSWGDDAFNRALYRGAGTVLTLCDYEKPWFTAAGVSPQALSAVGGYPEEKTGFSVRSTFGIAGPIALFNARRDSYKGYNLVLEAWKTARTCDPAWWLALVGPGFDKSINREEHVVTLPAQGGSPIADCDIFCMPSHSETFGVVYVEAWSHAKPVIACDIPSTRELFHAQEAGIIVRFDVSEIAAALARLMRNEPLRRAMGDAGKRLVTKFYSRDRYEHAVRAAYRRALGGNPL